MSEELTKLLWFIMGGLFTYICCSILMYTSEQVNSILRNKPGEKEVLDEVNGRINKLLCFDGNIGNCKGCRTNKSKCFWLSEDLNKFVDEIRKEIENMKEDV